MERKYEACFLLRGDLPEEEIEKEVEIIEKTLINSGANIVKKENWGRKTLAYPIKKKQEGVYYLFYFTAPPTIKQSIEENLKLRENILRYLLIKRKVLPNQEPVNAGTESE